MARVVEIEMDENERVTLHFTIGRLGITSVECWCGGRLQRERNEGGGVEAADPGWAFKTFGHGVNRSCRSCRIDRV